MASVLCLTLRFLDPVPQFHGRNDDSDPEWPPSPLRLFQALVCASATRWRENHFRDYARPALQLLETISPSIVAPQVAAKSFGYRMYVPNNSGDLMTAAWARGDTETSMAKFRVEKDVRPTRLTSEAVHYIFPIASSAAEFEKHKDVLFAAARSITHLGWGVDMVAGNAAIITDLEAAELKGECWRPMEDSVGNNLRVPISGTLDALISKHDAFLHRLASDGFKPVPPLSAFRVVSYRRDSEPVGRPFAAFSILKPEADGFHTFDPVRRTHIAAGMVRHATALAAEASGWSHKKINTYIHGHTEDGSAKALSENGQRRFSYLPLPTIGTKGGHRYDVAGSIRRVLVAGSTDGISEITWIRRALAGQELIDEDSHKAVALLTTLPTNDLHVKKYTQPASVWDTVSPVVLPGYDDANGIKTEKLLRQAIRQSGFSELLAKHAILDWRKVGFRPGLDLAQRYETSAHLKKYPRYHVRIEWYDALGNPIKIGGPIAIGGGRFSGFGLFAPTDDSD
jgi:CRISPR-associated protein Csb2